MEREHIDFDAARTIFVELQLLRNGINSVSGLPFSHEEVDLTGQPDGRDSFRQLTSPGGTLQHVRVCTARLPPRASVSA